MAITESRETGGGGDLNRDLHCFYRFGTRRKVENEPGLTNTCNVVAAIYGVLHFATYLPVFELDQCEVETQSKFTSSVLE